MRQKRVTRYISDCGKGFWDKKSCLNHEDRCRCWTNPKYKTCKTCLFGVQITDSNGMEHEPALLHTWRQWRCLNPKFNYDVDFTQAHENASDLCINCPKWEKKH